MKLDTTPRPVNDENEWMYLQVTERTGQPITFSHVSQIIIDLTEQLINIHHNGRTSQLSLTLCRCVAIQHIPYGSHPGRQIAIDGPTPIRDRGTAPPPRIGRKLTKREQEDESDW